MYHPFFWVLFELSGGDKHPLGDMSQFDSIFGVWGSGLILIRGKDNTNCLEVIGSRIR